MVNFILNGKPLSLDIDDTTPLLWALRDSIGLTGSKFGCGMGLCGACTVHVNGRAVRSCLTPINSLSGAEVLTIEGLSADASHPVQQAWKIENVVQCGYCQSGQIMSAAALLQQNSQPSDVDIDQAMSGNLCRCGTYQRIRKAIHLAADLQEKQLADSPLLQKTEGLA